MKESVQRNTVQPQDEIWFQLKSYPEPHDLQLVKLPAQLLRVFIMIYFQKYPFAT